MSFVYKCVFLFLATYSQGALGFSGDGMPLKYISSCEADFNGDSKPDKAFLIEGLAGRELLALMATKKGYDTFVVSKGKDNMHLVCKIANEVKDTKSASGTGKVYKVPGAYLELVKPESSSVAFIWTNNSFKEVWTAD